MPNYPKPLWDRIRSKKCDEIIKALEKDNYEYVCDEGRSLIYRRQADGRRLAIHYHPGKQYTPGLLKALYESAGWLEEADFRRVKLIK